MAPKTQVLSVNVWKHGAGGGGGGASAAGDAKEAKGKGAVLLAMASDLSGFALLKRRTIAENLRFMTRTIVERVPRKHRATVELADQPYLCHVEVMEDGLACAVLAQKDYERKRAFGLISKTLGDYRKVAPAGWKDVAKDVDAEPNSMKSDLAAFNSEEAPDKVQAVEKSVSDLKDVLATNLEALLAKGEKLEDLAQNSEHLSAMSKEFYKGAKKTHGCCTAF